VWGCADAKRGEAGGEEGGGGGLGGGGGGGSQRLSTIDK